MLRKIAQKLAATPAGDGTEAEPSEIRLRQITTFVLLVMVPILAAALYFTRVIQGKGLIDPDAQDFAQLARNLSHGFGLSTWVLRPLNADLAGDLLRQPDVTHGPLYPFILALTIGAAGAKDTVVVGTSGLFFVLTCWAVYFLGRRLFSHTIGVVSSLACATGVHQLDLGLSGLPIFLYVLLATLAAIRLHELATRVREAQEAGQPPKLNSLYASLGALAGFLYLAEPLLVVLSAVLLVMTIATVPSRERGRAALVGIGTFLVVAGWFMLRLGLLTGNPILGARGSELRMLSPEFVGLTGYRMLPTAFNVTTGDTVPSIGRKVLIDVQQFLETIPRYPMVWLVAFFLPALFIRFADPGVMLVRKTFCWGFLGVLLVNLLLGINIKLYMAMLPVFLVIGVSYIYLLIQQSQMRRGTRVMVSLLLGLTVVYPTFSVTVLLPRPAPVVEQEIARTIRARSATTDIIVSDKPWLTAWYAERPSLWVPFADGVLDELRTRSKDKIRWYMLTREIVEPSYSPSWQQVYYLTSGWNQANVNRLRAGQPALAPIAVPERLAEFAKRNGTPFELESGLKGFITFPQPGFTRPETAVGFIPARATTTRGAGTPTGAAR